MNINPGIVEFQAFRNNNDRFIIKELVFLDLLTYVVYPFYFKPPFPFTFLNGKAKRTNNWMTKNFHHLQWNEGLVSYTDLHNIMYHFCNKFSNIYTRGLEKRNMIKTYSYGSVVDVNVPKDFSYQYGNICDFAKDPKHGQLHCALQNAYRLAAYLKENQCLSSGGDNGGYKYDGATQTQHEYYSRL